MPGYTGRGRPVARNARPFAQFLTGSALAALALPSVATAQTIEEDAGAVDQIVDDEFANATPDGHGPRWYGLHAESPQSTKTGPNTHTQYLVELYELDNCNIYIKFLCYSIYCRNPTGQYSKSHRGHTHNSVIR